MSQPKSTEETSNLPYRTRIMMSTNIKDNNQSNNRKVLVNSKLSNFNIQKMKPLNARRNFRAFNPPMSNHTHGDLQPLQWLHQDAILSIDPIDNEEEFVPGKDDIISVTTSPIKVDIVAEAPPHQEETKESSPKSTIDDFYRYQAMRAAMSNGQSNGMRSSSQSNLHQPNEYQKPPFSYTHIIFMAIETSPNKAMTVNDIYMWCETHFPYYTQAGVGWKNSLRHNLSINKSFKKISRDSRGGPGRGAYWVVEPRERANLIEAIRRSPCSIGSIPVVPGKVAGGSQVCANTATILTNSANFQRSSILNTALQKSSILDKGSLIRIESQVTDASQILNHINNGTSSIIKRICSTESTSLIELTNSTFPLIQLEQALNLNPINVSSSNSEPDVADESELRGKVKWQDQDWADLEPEVEKAFIDMFKNLTEIEVYKNVNNEKSRHDIVRINRDCPEHGGKKKKSLNTQKSKSDSVNSSDTPTTGKERKRKASQLSRRCLCIRAAYDSDDSESIYSNDDVSEMSDTDFNLKMNLGRRNQHKERHRSNKSCHSNSLNRSKCIISHNSASISSFQPSKNATNFRMSSRSYNARSRINSITRAPHSDHVYAFLQEYLVPVNLSEETPQPPDSVENNQVSSYSHSLSNLQSSGSNTQSSITNCNDQSNVSQSSNVECEFFSQLSKRTKSKWQSIRELSLYNNAYNNSITMHSYSPATPTKMSPERSTTNKYQAMRRMKRSYEQIVENNVHHNRHYPQHIHQYDDEISRNDAENYEIDDDDREEQENLFTFSRLKRDRIRKPLSVDSSCSDSALCFSAVSPLPVSIFPSSRKKTYRAGNAGTTMFHKTPTHTNAVRKRKVGRPRKFINGSIDLSSPVLQPVGDENMDEWTSNIKVPTTDDATLPNKCLKESNIDMSKSYQQGKKAEKFINKDEQAAIAILANLHKKTNQRQKTLHDKNQTQTQTANNKSTCIH